MAEFSDDSDVNPSEMARMVEDLDDLDDTLLGGSAKKQDPFTGASRDKEIAEAKKRVAFKEFNKDDPLADLLSDDDNDDDDDDDEASYETRKPIVTRATKSNLVADLFGIKDTKSAENMSESGKLENNSSTMKKAEWSGEKTLSATNLPISIDKKSLTAATTRDHSIEGNIREKTRTNDEISGKMENSEKLTNVKARKSTLMEDLFGTRARSAPSKEIEARPSFAKSNVENPGNSIFSELPKSERSTKSSSGYNVDPGIVREPRRGRRNSPIISDPLGLFSTTKENEPVVKTPIDVEKKVEKRSNDKVPVEDLPEWLGGTGKTRETKFEREKQPADNEKFDKDAAERNSVTTNTREFNANESATDFSWQKNHETTIFCPDLTTMMGTQFDQQAAIISMQQQEHELKTAAVLSRQNEQVTKIVENQRAKLDEQGKMFNVLIKHQLDRQSMLETQMKIQQARIDHYIQTLMSQPTSLPTGVYKNEKIFNDTHEEIDKSSSPENSLRKLELEKVCLENTIEILKEKHEKETTILQESYEKQMFFLRQGMEKLEKKMYQDCETMDNECSRKIEKLRREKEEIEQTYREEIERLKKNEKISMEEIYDRNSQNIELLQKQHNETIDEISRAKEIERNAIDAMSNRRNDLDDLLKSSQLVIENFQNLEKKLEDKNQEFVETRGACLRKQEENLQLLRDQLNLQQESLANERDRLLKISERLDESTTRLTGEFEKNRSIVNETEERLATRERALIRDKQLFDEQIKWEREHLRVTKDAWTKEQERQIQWLFNEREAVASERAKFEVSNRIKNGTDDMAKVELEAALRMAREAASEANQERRKWQEKNRNIDEERAALREKERNLIDGAKELESLTETALAKREEGLEALREAKRVEQRHGEHVARLQIQLENLARRERKKSSDKLTLARERLAARTYPAEKPEKDTAKRVSPVNYSHERSLPTNSHVTTHFKDVVDPHLLLLKLNLDDKLDTTDELLATMQISQ